MIYFIRAAGTEAVKIGFALDVEHRLAELQCGNHLDLTVLRVIDGGQAAEKWLHRQFASRQLRREWFAFDETMLSIEPPIIMPRPRRQAELHTWDGIMISPSEITRRCTSRGMSRSQLCRRIGVVSTTLTRWLNGQTSPRYDTYNRLLDAMAEAEAGGPPP